MTSLRSAAALLLLCHALCAQDLRTSDVRGTLRSGQETYVHDYLAELKELAHHGGEPIRVEVAADGAFTFRHVPCGDYLLRITTYDGTPVTQQFVTVREQLPPFEVSLPGGHPARPPDGHVSLKELRHPPARKAVEALAASEKLTQSGRYAEAVVELQKAIRISPDFAPAHSHLAVQYIRLHRYEDAKAEIGRAVEIAGPNAPDLCNLTYAQAELEQYEEAAASARAALAIDPGHAPAHYLLGILLLRTPGMRVEAVDHLRRAAPSMEGARTLLERLGQGAVKGSDTAH